LSSGVPTIAIFLFSTPISLLRSWYFIVIILLVHVFPAVGKAGTLSRELLFFRSQSPPARIGRPPRRPSTPPLSITPEAFPFPPQTPSEPISLGRPETTRCVAAPTGMDTQTDLFYGQFLSHDCPTPTRRSFTNAPTLAFLTPQQVQEAVIVSNYPFCDVQPPDRTQHP